MKRASPICLATLVCATALAACRPSATPTAQVAVTVFPTPTIAPTIAATSNSVAVVAPTLVAQASPTPAPTLAPTVAPPPTPTPKPTHPLQIDLLRGREYPGSDLVIEQTLPPGGNYSRYVVSYLSEGLKIYALLTVPNGKKPASGWPVVIFNHGYIPPSVYRTTERYIAYTDAFSRNGYIVLKSDYRGHGSSEGSPTGAYGSPGYTVDVLNALASVKRYKDADPKRIGMWGHSMGGNITLRSMVIDRNADIKAGVIWGGVVGTYQDMLERWRRPQSEAGGAA